MLLKSPHLPLQKSFKRSPLNYALLVSPQNKIIEPETLNLNSVSESSDNSTEWEEKSIFDGFKRIFKPLFNFGPFLNSEKEGESKLVNTYFILIVLLITCLTMSFSIQSSTSWLKDFSLDLASEIIGILLVVFSVDRVIDAESQKKKKQREAVAVQQIKNAFIRHLYILYEIASNHPNASACAAKPSLKGSLQLIYDKIQSNMLNQNNWSLEDIKIYPELLHADKIDNFQDLSTEICNFRNLLNGILEKYSYFLQADKLNAIETVINSPFVLFLEQVSKRNEAIEALNNNANFLNSNSPVSLNQNQSNLDIIFTSYLKNLFKLIEVCY